MKSLTTLVLLLLAVHAAPAAVHGAPAAEPSAAASPAISDPPRDVAHPARNRQLVIPSGPVVPALGRFAEMNALFLLAAGEGPKPTMILLHGLPGNERNLDLAQAVRRAGWNVLTFTYRGAWGSEGSFSIQHAIEDAMAALGFLRSPQAQLDYGVDPGRIVIAGHSMGGYIAAHVAARDRLGCAESASARPATAPRIEGARIARSPCVSPPLAGIVLLDAWNIGRDAAAVRAGGEQGRAAFVAALDDLGHALGPVTADDLYQELVRSGDEWQLAAHAPALARLPILTISATDGNAEEIRALAGTIRAAPGARVQVVELETDHSFADKRVTLAEEVVGWLQQGPPSR